MYVKLPFNTKREIFLWGPVPGKFFFLAAFVEANYKYFHKKYSGDCWPKSLFLFKDSRMFFVNDQKDLLDAGEKVFVKYMLKADARKKIYKEWKAVVGKLCKIEDKIQDIDLSKISNKQLLALWNEFHKEYIDFWTSGLVPELGNYGYNKFFVSKLKGMAPDGESLSLVEILTAPEKISFYQQEEIDLIKTDYISKHQKKYFWLKNSYNGAEILGDEFFSKRKKRLSVDKEKEMKLKIKQAKQKKIWAKKHYGLSLEIMNIASAITAGIVWQDERKKYIFIALHFQDLMLKEIAKRFNYTPDILYHAWFGEIANIMTGKNLHQESEKRSKGYGVLYYKKCRSLYATEIDYLWKVYDGLHQMGGEVKELKGVVASKGKGNVTAKVCIMFNPSQVDDFEPGSILVAPMTSPEYIFAMRKAVAVITDVGGLTSHAAIVSRELGIPCVVGTKIATKILKNGQLVEVDVFKGVITIV
jgi:phosphohistidine swiveling domain-containing protein